MLNVIRFKSLRESQLNQLKTIDTQNCGSKYWCHLLYRKALFTFATIMAQRMVIVEIDKIKASKAFYLSGAYINHNTPKAF